MASITALQREAGEAEEVSLLNFVVSDGATLVATRFVSRDDCAAATMYYAEGVGTVLCTLLRQYSKKLSLRRPCSNAVQAANDMGSSQVLRCDGVLRTASSSWSAFRFDVDLCMRSN